jgi:sterol desaturase/sphingolipid hydroxylase (fatty acid hydroxylase superfamily)
MELTRLIWFLSGFIAFLSIGVIRPFRKHRFSLERFLSNTGLGLLDALFLKIFTPLTLIELSEKNLGPLSLNSLLEDFPIGELILGILILDFSIYIQHILTHKIPLLWRFHRIHHGDTEFDTSTALRFHPCEALFSFIYKATIVFLIGPSAATILAFEILLNFSAMFNHGNFALPKKVEAMISPLIVTPSFHRVHHSPIRKETNSNYGFFLSIWDHLFKTRTKESSGGIGLDKEKDKACSKKLMDLLLSPFN